jgi:signal transduction histidine kinase
LIYSNFYRQYNGLLSRLEGFLKNSNNKAEKFLVEDIKQEFADLEKINKDLESFAYTCSHDLKEPLRNIASFVQIIESEAKLDKNIRKYFDHILTNVTKINQLVEDILYYSTMPQNLKKEIIDTKDLIEEIKELIILSIQKNNATIKFDNLPSIFGYKPQIIRLFKNLIENSIKFRSEKKLEIEISSFDDEEFWHFKFCDNGIGVHKKDRKKIFGMFTKSNSIHSGSGIGLGICSEIVKSHGGNIWVRDNSVCGGTCIHFTIKKV